jgi:hypothetical protein
MLSYQEILKLAQELSEDEQTLLANDLLAKHSSLPSRESLITELSELREAGAFENIPSLYGKFAHPAVPEISTEDLYAQLNEMATEWEQELHDFDSDN